VIRPLDATLRAVADAGAREPPEVWVELLPWFEEEGVQRVVTIDRIIGCPPREA
jgi:hypothetical protein